jgi:AcrR family transcriptional regulator
MSIVDERAPAVRTASPRGRKSRKAALVRIAARSFHEQGYDRTSVRDIAASCGMTSGSIFYHFATKEDLLAWVVEEGMRHGHDIAERELTGKTGAAERYRAVIFGHLKALHDNQHEYAVSVREWDKLPPETRDTLRQMNNRFRERWTGILNDLRDAGILRSEPEVLRRMQVAAVSWTVHLRPEEVADLETLADRIAAGGLNMTLAEFRALLTA